MNKVCQTWTPGLVTTLRYTMAIKAQANNCIALALDVVQSMRNELENHIRED